jgi:hypothetical protein
LHGGIRGEQGFSFAAQDVAHLTQVARKHEPDASSSEVLGGFRQHLGGRHVDKAMGDRSTAAPARSLLPGRVERGVARRRTDLRLVEGGFEVGVRDERDAARESIGGSVAIDTLNGSGAA